MNREQQREEERGGSAEEHGELSDSKERERAKEREESASWFVCCSVNFFFFQNSLLTELKTSPQSPPLSYICSLTCQRDRENESERKNEHGPNLSLPFSLSLFRSSYLFIDCLPFALLLLPKLSLFSLSLHHLSPVAWSKTYDATALISSGESCPPQAGMAPLPLVTWERRRGKVFFFFQTEAGASAREKGR